MRELEKRRRVILTTREVHSLSLNIMPQKLVFRFIKIASQACSPQTCFLVVDVAAPVRIHVFGQLVVRDAYDAVAV